MDRERVRKIAQIALATVAVLAAVGAVWRFVGRGGAESLFGSRIVATPAAGPIGVRPHLELRGFPGGQEVTVYMCPAAGTALEDCFEMGMGTPDDRIRSAPVPTTLPDGTEVELTSYVLRAEPDENADDPVRGTFDVVPFSLGAVSDPVSYAGLAPDDIILDDPTRIARGVACRPPVFMPDGRIAVGLTVFDPATGVTVEMPLAATELHWSPVGDKLAILTADRKEIRLAGPDGVDPVTRVREARGLLSSPSWSPDGDRLAYIAAPDPETRGGPAAPTVQILNAINGEITEAGLGLSVAWSPRGDVLAVERIGPRIELSDLEGSRSELVEGAEPSWSADGRFLAFVREGGEAWVSLADGSRPARVASGEVCAASFSWTARTMALVTGAGESTELSLSSFAPEEA